MIRRLLLCAGLCLPLSALATTIYKFTDANGVVNFTDRPTGNAQVFTFQDRMVEHLETQVHLDTQRTGTGLTFSVRNDLYAPVEVDVRLTGISNALEAPSRVRRVIPARSTVSVVQLRASQPGRAVQATPSFKYALGDPSTRPVLYRYPLPWVGGPFRLTQGPNGQYSHFGPKGRYAMDIAMPVGTPIVAARGGVVVKIENGQTGRGTNPSGNFVRILHDDGTMGVYLHLQEGSVVVREGQRVAQGTALARSGNTGNSSGPHLHFVVQRNVGLALESIPYQFNQPIQSLPNFAVGGN